MPDGAHLASAKLKPVLVAVGKATPSRSGTLHITLRLTANGKRLLKHHERLKLTGLGTLAQTGERAVLAIKSSR